MAEDATEPPPAKRVSQRAAMSGIGQFLGLMRSTASTQSVQNKQVETVESTPPAAEASPQLLPSPSSPQKRTPIARSIVVYPTLSADARGSLEGAKLRQTISAYFCARTTPNFRFASPSVAENNYVRCVSFAPSGRFLVCDAEDRRVRVFRVDTSSEAEALNLHNTTHHGGLVYDLAWSPCDDELYATTSAGSPVQIWNADGALFASFLGINHLDQLDCAYCMTFSTSGAHLYTGYRGALRKFDIERPGRQTSTLKTGGARGQTGQKTILSCIAASPRLDGVFAVGSYGSGVGLYSDYTASCDTLVECKNKFVTCVRYSSDAQRLFIGGRNSQTIECYDVRQLTPKPLATYRRAALTNQRFSFEIDAADKFLFTGTSNGEICVFDLTQSAASEEKATAPIEATWTRADASRSAISSLSLHPTAPILATAHGQRVFPTPRIAAGSDSEDDDKDDPKTKIESYERLIDSFENSIKLWQL